MSEQLNCTPLCAAEHAAGKAFSEATYGTPEYAAAEKVWLAATNARYAPNRLNPQSETPARTVGQKSPNPPDSHRTSQ